MNEHVRPVGDLFREWRQRRRMSQLDLASEAEISSRHLSFIESGRARPSREMILRLCERLDVPLRERNIFLLAAGHAPVFPRRALDDPALAAARRAVELVLTGHEPYPALAVDRHWNVIAANRAVPPLMAGADEDLLRPPVNVLRLSLHPRGLASRIENLAEWRGHVLARLDRQIEMSADPALVDLHRELSAYPASSPERRAGTGHEASFVVPLRFATETGTLSLFTTTTVFGTPVDVTLSELAIEAFFPADEATASALRALCPDGRQGGGAATRA